MTHGIFPFMSRRDSIGGLVRSLPRSLWSEDHFVDPKSFSFQFQFRADELETETRNPKLLLMVLVGADEGTWRLSRRDLAAAARNCVAVLVDAHAEREAHGGQDLFDLVQRLAPEILRLKH